MRKIGTSSKKDGWIQRRILKCKMLSGKGKKKTENKRKVESE